MRIYRIEHDRNVCTSEIYRTGGESPTGHGTSSGCYNWIDRPNFGHAGRPPHQPMLRHERCAVTQEQFNVWVGARYDYTCRDTTLSCANDGICSFCEPERFDDLVIPDEWQIVVYEINDAHEGIDWREDEYQIVFNPAFATRVGTITPNEIASLTGVEIAA